MSQEERFAQIGEAVLTLATDGGEGEDCLGEYIEHDTFPDAINHCLYDMECRRRETDPTYDITTEPPENLSRLLDIGLGHGDREAERVEAEEREISETLTDENAAQGAENAAQGAENAAQGAENAAQGAENAAQGAENTAENREATAESYQEAVNELSGMPNTEKIQALINDGRVPETYKEQLRAFNQIIAIADRVPADAAIVRQHINQIDLSQGVPSPASFARAFIFDSADRSTGVSAATQEAIASELGISLNGVAPPRNASDLQTTLRDGRGVERETEIRRVEEPAGSGNFVEKEVVVSERTLPFTEADPVIINLNPRVEAFPIAEGSQTHIIKAYVTAGEPSRLQVDIPEHGSLPTTDINNFVVSQQTQALLANHGYAGAINELLGSGDSATGISTNAVQPTLDQTDPSRVMTQTLLGSDFAADGRFLSQEHLNQMEANLRSLAVDGDFGAFNRMGAAQATALMRGMLGEGQANVVPNLNRLRDVINSGGAEAPSYQLTYAAMYPEDAAAGYPRLRGIIGDDGMAMLNLGVDTAV